jgi:enamine deaminase RidA (YjgF/YER057c/UK114 family)
MRIIKPAGLPEPRGYSDGVAARGDVLFIAGQVGWNERGELVSERLVDQFDQALANILTVVRAAGGDAASLARLTIYVLDAAEYRAAGRELGERYRARMGRHYPAMTLVEVRALLEPAARVEIEATAVLGA